MWFSIICILHHSRHIFYFLSLACVEFLGSLGGTYWSAQPFFSITPQPLNMGCVRNRILPYRWKTVCDKRTMPEFKIVIKEAKSTQMGHLTIPWVHGKGFVNDSDTMQLTLVGHMTITTYFGPFSQQRKSENFKCIYLQKVNLFSYTKSLE